VNTHLLAKLKALIAQGGAKRLPTVRDLAAHWQIPPSQIQQVFQQARLLGWIVTRDRSGSWAAGQAPKPVMLPERNNSATVANALHSGVQAGQWGSGEKLPAPKMLAAQQGVHPATIRKALQALVSEGILERQGRTWSVAHPRNPRSKQMRQSVLWCIGAPDTAGGLRLGSDREWEFWREIQSEAMRNGLNTLHLAWKGRLPRLRYQPIGAIISTWHLENPHSLLSALQRAKLPSAIWLENPQLSTGRPTQQTPWLGFHDMAYGKEAGTLLGKHPLVRKHKRIAWISPFHGAEWSRNRLAGLRSALPDSISIHEALGHWVSEWDFQTSVWHENEIWKHVNWKGMELKGDDPELVRPMVEAIGINRLFQQFSSTLEAALASKATLWIASSDQVGLKCLDWLADHGIQVPKDLAMIGFDDTREAFRRGLTSFRFDAQAMARAMVRQVLLPGKQNAQAIHYEGTLIVRDSTPWE
jgi:DNA-binding LacI/PurR family transcriptional regulator/DNA-binding transcriptional regulator YhcF (GntR family)